MKILQVHKYLYRKAGAEAYVLELADLLVRYGHEVGLWGTSEKFEIRNSKFEIFGKLLVDPLNFDRREGMIKDLKKFGHMVWSTEAGAKFDRVLDEFQPDIIHLHNIYHHISPSILPVAAKHRIPVVMTVHDWHLLNPNYTLYDHGAICERQGLCAVVHRCLQDSYTASFAGVVAWRIHQWMRVYERYVAKFLAPTEFVKRKLVEGGMDSAQIEVVPLPVYPEDRPPELRRTVLPYILYGGRLTEEKGAYLVLEIARQLPEIQFKIAGAGPEAPNIQYQISNITNVELLGFLEKAQLQEWIAGARLIIVPSLWYDLSPLAMLEAMAAGKVVLASRIGGIPDLIKDGETGFLVSPGDLPSWVDKIKKICYDDALLKRIGNSAQEYVKQVHGAKIHYDKILEIYRAIRN